MGNFVWDVKDGFGPKRAVLGQIFHGWGRLKFAEKSLKIVSLQSKFIINMGMN